MASIEIKVIRELRGDWWHGAMRTFFEDAMLDAYNILVEPGRLPIDNHKLGDSLAPGAGGTYVDPKNPPTFARVGAPKGSETEEYGSALDNPQSRTPHYADGPSRGNPTKGWMSSAPDAIEGDIRRSLDDFAANLERAWKHG